MTLPPRPGTGAPAAGVLLVLLLPAAAGAQVQRVGPDGTHATIGSALAAAAPGDTVRVAPGTYRERLVVGRPVVLVGEGWPVLDGGGEGHVVEATAALEIAGFVIRGSGTSVDLEHSGVMVRGAPARVERNRLEDVFYGVYLKDAPRSVIRGNRIRGKDLPPPRRGDGIRLWYSHGTSILGNDVERTRDVVVYFSDSLVVADNRIVDGRYGLHYMYSHHNRFLRNRFLRNQVGAFIMYSRDIALRENVFAEARGATGMGLGLKDADSIRVEDNLFVANAAGLYLDNSPTARDVRNRVADNVVLYNRTGVELLPSVRGNDFTGNAFVGNDRPALVSGGTGRGQARQNDWDGNHWGGYSGFDGDGDGIGDTPYVHARLADQLVARYPEFRLFTLSPALRLVDALGRFFPLLRPQPVVVDSAPRLESAALERWRSEPPVEAARAARGGPPADGGGPGTAAVWAGVALLSLGTLWRGRRW